MFGWFKKKKVDSRLPFPTDIHCHLVPGIDDGSKSVESSVELLQHMQQWGITRIIPTPHVTEDTFENTPATIDPAYGALVAGANDSGIEIEILPPYICGQRVRICLDCLSGGRNHKTVKPVVP